MKKMFWGYIPLIEEDYKDIWSNSKIVLDTNILLNLYRYSESTQKQVIKILDEKKERFILPKTIIEEFFDNRLKVIIEHNCIKTKLIEDLGISDMLNKAKSYRHSGLDNEKLTGIITSFKGKIEAFLKTCKTEDYLEKDVIMEKITEWFNEKIIDEIKTEDLTKVYEEAEERYKEKIPPGYKDKDKNGNRKYSDFIIWKQLIEYASREKTNILFISDDLKEDWIRDVEGKKIGPREELLNEFFVKTQGQKIYIYSTNGFLNAYSKYNENGEKIDVNTIHEVKEIEKEAMGMEDKIRADFHDQYMHTLRKQIDPKLFSIDLNKKYKFDFSSEDYLQIHNSNILKEYDEIDNIRFRIDIITNEISVLEINSEKHGDRHYETVNRLRDLSKELLNIFDEIESFKNRELSILKTKCRDQLDRINNLIIKLLTYN